MTAQEIKNLPKEFDFKSNINPYGLTYHAVEKESYYVVTTDRCEWKINKLDFRKNLLNDNYVIKQEELPYTETTEYGLKNIYTGEIWPNTFDCEYLANKFRSRNMSSVGWYIIQRKVKTYEWEELE